MLHSKELSFSQAGLLTKLLQNYFDKESNLKPFYGSFPNLDGFEHEIKKSNYSNLNRETLVNCLTVQHQLVTNTTQQSYSNIQKLSNSNCYTITTGHQLCLFTGPLYFIYKIFSVIRLCEELNKKYTGKQFVPVYWMASEDHDFAEINHLNLFGKTLIWESEQKGAVGNFSTTELGTFVSELKPLLGASENAADLLKIFEAAYLGHRNLSDATRYLVNELFGSYGLICIDGNNATLKKQIIPLLKQDVFENTCFKVVNQSIKKLEELGYSAQVKPRPINCFYVEEGLRARIEKEGENYRVLGTDKMFSAEELNNLIDEKPQCISPNVVLRPLYQQFILPNLAYVGGPGEIAYWLEFKDMFDKLNVFYPILVPRDFILVVEKSVRLKIEKLGFAPDDFFKPEQVLIQEFQIRNNQVLETDTEKTQITAVYNTLFEKVSTADKTLGASVSAELQKVLSGLDTIQAKTNKALKQKFETEITQIKTIKQKLFPGAIPQERVENFSVFYLKYGKEFLKAVHQQSMPLNLVQKLLIEE